MLNGYCSIQLSLRLLCSFAIAIYIESELCSYFSRRAAGCIVEALFATSLTMMRQRLKIIAPCTDEDFRIAIEVPRFGQVRAAISWRFLRYMRRFEEQSIQRSAIQSLQLDMTHLPSLAKYITMALKDAEDELQKSSTLLRFSPCAELPFPS